MSQLTHEQTIVIEILKDILTLPTAVQEVENTFGVRLTQRSSHGWAYADPDGEYTIAVFIPKDNIGKTEEIVFKYTDFTHNYTIDSALTHRELNTLLAEAFQYRCYLATD